MYNELLLCRWGSAHIGHPTDTTYLFKPYDEGERERRAYFLGRLSQSCPNQNSNASTGRTHCGGYLSLLFTNRVLRLPLKGVNEVEEEMKSLLRPRTPVRRALRISFSVRLSSYERSPPATTTAALFLEETSDGATRTQQEGVAALQASTTRCTGISQHKKRVHYHFHQRRCGFYEAFFLIQQ